MPRKINKIACRRGSRLHGQNQTSATNIMPTIIYPWEFSDWEEIKEKIAAINGLVSMQIFIAERYRQSVTMHTIADLFRSYMTTHPNIQTDSVLDNIVIPWLRNLILGAQKIMPRLHTLSFKTNITLTQRQSATIVAMMLFALFEREYIHKAPGIPLDINNFSVPSFANIYRQGNIFALECLIGYFIRMIMLDQPQLAPELVKHTNGIFPEAEMVAAAISALPTNPLDTRTIIYVRKSYKHPAANLTDDIIRAYYPQWSQSTAPLSDISFGDGPVEDSECAYQMVPCTEFIGGRLFSTEHPNLCLTYEETILLTRPDCLPLILFTSELGDDAIAVIGAEKFSQYVGNGSSVTYTSHHIEANPFEDRQILRVATLFADPSDQMPMKSQLYMDFIRDLNKIYTAMTIVNTHGAVASSNINHGFLANDLQIKFIQLWLAASEAGRPLVYHGPRDFEDHIQRFYSHVMENIAGLAAEIRGIAQDNTTQNNNEPTVGDLFIVLRAVTQEKIKRGKLSKLQIFNEIMDW